MTALAIHNHVGAATLRPVARAMDSQSSDSAGSSTEGATISANDFLTLLVTEMKNQDPTANTDPNEYINQLVNVNSLEQLISINQTLSTALDPSTITSGSGQPQGAMVTADTATNGVSTSVAAGAHAVAASTVHSVHGNLGVSAVNPSAERVASSLGEAHNTINHRHSGI